MALTDIVSPDRLCGLMARGNIGTLTGMSVESTAVYMSITRTVPDTSDVRGGVQYGVNGTELTGTAPTDEEIAEAIWTYNGPEGRTLT